MTDSNVTIADHPDAEQMLTPAAVAFIAELQRRFGPRRADRRVEITGPVERKMMINALNSGAKVFMADLEDANSPTWDNVVRGQVNLQDAVRGTIEHVTDA